MTRQFLKRLCSLVATGQVSTKAETCPHCGAQAGHGEGTPKMLKGMMLLGALAALAGAAVFVYGIKIDDGQIWRSGAWAIGSGIVWVFLFQMVIWWRHD